MSRRATIGAALVMLALVAGGWTTASADGEALSARAFEVRFRPLADAADVVSPLLSERGTLTLRPRLKTMVVEDRPDVLRRVAELLDGWDVPPRNVEFTLTLLLGSQATDDESSGPGGRELSTEVRGVLDMLGDVTRWTRYESLGSRSVTGSAGDAVSAELADGYRVVFHVDAVHEPSKRIKVRLSLQHDEPGAGGATPPRELYTAAMTIPEGRVKVVGAAPRADAEEALFLTLRARLR